MRRKRSALLVAFLITGYTVWAIVALVAWGPDAAIKALFAAAVLESGFALAGAFNRT